MIYLTKRLSRHHNWFDFSLAFPVTAFGTKKLAKTFKLMTALA